MKNSFSYGFTLVELLIAIAIVGIITSIGFASARAIQMAGRDAQRKTDLRSLQSSLQQYYTDQNSYPDTLPQVGASLVSPGNTRTYMNKIPGDPSTGSSYIYVPTCNNASPNVCHTYVLYTNLENGTNDSYAYSGKTYNFQITPLN